MALRSRSFQWLTAVAVVVVLAAGITAALTFKEEEDYPAAWDARVLDLAQFVERERGALFDHPVPVDFLTPEEYSERTRTDEGSLTDEEKEEIEQFEGMLRALGLLDSEADLLETTNDLTDTGTLAYYDPEDERVVIRGTEVTPGLAVTLVHELTHVLQDQVFELDRYEELDEDEVTSGQDFAFTALIEGDADRIEQIYVETLDDETQDAIDAENTAGLDEFEDADIPAALTSLFGAPYGFGDVFVQLMDLTKGRSVDAAFQTPPTTEEQVFDPFEYFAGRAAAPVDGPDTDGAEAYDEDDFGAVSLLIVLAERIDPRQALVAATGWGGDAYVAFPRDERTCIRLNVTGDTGEDTDELEDALAAWVAAAPAGSATASRAGDIVHLESCDPGPDAAGGTGGSEEAVGLAVARNYVALGALSEGAEEDQAQCFASALVLELTMDELAGDEATPEVAERVSEIVRRCQ